MRSIETLVDFVKGGGNIFTVIDKPSTTRSFYHEHYRNGDTNGKVEGLPIDAKVGTVVGEMVCISTYITDPEFRGWSGCTTSTRWITLGELEQIIPMLSKARQLLTQEGLTIEGVTVEELLKMPIDWGEILPSGLNGISVKHGYYSGSKGQIVVDDKFITITHTIGENSMRRGWTIDKPIAQYFKSDFSDNTANYKGFLFRQRRREKIFETMEKYDLSYEKSQKWFKVKAQWKHEFSPSECFKFAEEYNNKTLWESLSQTQSWTMFHKRAKSLGGSEWSLEMSHPRATGMACAIAQLCTEDDPMFLLREKGWLK